MFNSKVLRRKNYANTEELKMNGTVKFYNRSKNFGFITAEDGKDYFVHVSGLNENLTELEENQNVSFDVEDGERGPKAVNVNLQE